MDDQRFGKFEDILEMTPAPLRAVAIRLREIILAVDPNTVLVVRTGDRAATFGIGPKKMSEGYAHILPYTDWVNLGFYRGVDLDDPCNLLEGTGTKMRHVKIRSLEECEKPAIVDLIRCAFIERKRAVRQK